MAAFYRQRWFPYVAGGGLLVGYLGWRYWQRKKAEEAAAAEGTQITEGPEGVYVAISPSQAADYGEFGAIGSLEPLMDRDRVEGPGAEPGYVPTPPPTRAEIPPGGIVRPPEYYTTPVELPEVRIELPPQFPPSPIPPPAGGFNIGNAPLDAQTIARLKLTAMGRQRLREMGYG